MENLKLCAHLFASLIGSLASLHSRFARVVEQAFSGKLRCTRFPKSFNVGKQLKRLRQMPYVLRNFEFFHDNKIIQFIATTIMAGKHGFLGEILLTKDFSPLGAEKSSAFDFRPFLFLNGYVT